MDRATLEQIAATRGRLALAMILAAVVPLLALAMISVRQQESVAIDDAFDRLDGLASAQVAHLEGIAEADRELANLIADNAMVRSGLGEHADGVEVNAENLAGVLAQMIGASNRLENITLYDTSGRVLATAVPGSDERSLAERFEPATDHLLLRVVPDPEDGERALTTATVITGGEVVGTLLIETDARVISQLASDYGGLSRTGELSIAQQSPDGAQFIAPLRFREGAVLNMTVPSSRVDAPITLAMLGIEGRHVGTVDYRGQDVLAVTRHIDATGWGVVVKMDTAEALSGVTQFRDTVRVALATSIALLMAVSYVVSRSVWRPVSEVTAAAVAVARGDRARRADVRHGGEIGALARAVNTMTDDLVAGATADAERREELEVVNHRLSAREAELRHQATHDPLTGLPNRTRFRECLEAALEKTDSEAAVLFLDLDQFKLVNDSRGHSAGDDLLRRVSARLAETVMHDDVVGRFGGDEFVVLRSGHTNERHALRLAARIHEAFDEPVIVGDEPVHVSFSIGVAMTTSQSTSESVIANADVAMYTAKAKGRNQTVLFDREMRGMVEARHDIETALRRAIPNDEIEVFYQPIVELETGEICAVEALARWHRRGHGWVSPTEFVGVAEDSGLIVPLGRSVFRRVCQQQVAWADAHPGTELRITVNVSAAELVHPQYLTSVRSILSETGASADSLTIELTETVLTADIETAIANLVELRRLGFMVALDDFGTGFSSLTYLWRLPIDTVKIDRSFMSELASGPQDSSIVSLVVALARKLDLGVIAEGVETEEQLAVLHELECDHAQGFLFSEPKSAADIERLLWPDIDLVTITGEAA